MAGTSIGAAGVTFPDASAQSVAATREVFVPVDLSDVGTNTWATIGYRTAAHLDANGEFTYFMTFQVPADFTTLTSCVVVLLSTDAAADLDWTVDTDFAAVGEATGTHTDSATADAYAPAQNQIANLDISAALTGLLAGDVLGMKFTLDVANGTSVEIFGYNFKYT